MEALSWQPERGSFLLVLDRTSGAEVARVPVGSRYCLHQIDAFDAGDRLVVDLVELDRPVYDQYEVLPDLFTAVAPGRPVRYEVDVERGAIVARRDLPYDRAPDFPSLDTRRALRGYRHLWLLGIAATGRPGRKFFDQLVHLDWQEPERIDLWTAPPACYLAGQPVLAGDPGEDEAGTLLCPLFDAERLVSSVLLFDARRVAAGPFATVRLPQAVPPLFHACWA
jgi:carotenoid cleavage dioxygenase-like enzyme